MRIILWLLTHAAGLAAAAWLLDGIRFAGARSGTAELQDKWLPLLGVAVVLGLVTMLVRPVVRLLSFPLIILTVGLFLLVINALMLMLTAWIADGLDLGFRVDGFWTALLGGLVITVVTWGVDRLLGSES